MSHAKTIGHITPNNPHPTDSAIFWTGLGICKNRILNITKKRGLNRNITNCLKINKRQEWVNHLLKQSQLTSSGWYSERQVKKIEKKMPKKLSLLERAFQAINCGNNYKSKWKLEETKKGKVHDRKILLSKIITIYHHLSKTIRPNRLFLIPTLNHIATHNWKQFRSKNV